MTGRSLSLVLERGMRCQLCCVWWLIMPALDLFSGHPVLDAAARSDLVLDSVYYVLRTCANSQLDITRDWLTLTQPI